MIWKAKRFYEKLLLRAMAKEIKLWKENEIKTERGNKKTKWKNVLF